MTAQPRNSSSTFKQLDSGFFCVKSTFAIFKYFCYTASFNLRYGKILSTVTRDNVEIELTGKANADGSTGTEKSGSTAIATDGSLKVKIGRQINGAAADLVKAGADPDKVVEALTKDETETK